MAHEFNNLMTLVFANPERAAEEADGARKARNG
jgi:hypothetical protein